MAVIQTEVIPQRIPPKQRARLIKLQRQKVMRQLKNTYFVFEPQTMTHVTAFNSKLEQGIMTPAFVDLLNKTEIKWRVMGYILSRESNGKNKMEPIEILVNTPCKHEEIASLVADELMSHVEEFMTRPHGKNFVTASWAAMHMDTEISDDTAYQLMDIAVAWKLPSDREEEDAQQN